MSPPRWRWENTPLPEAHLAAVGAAALAHVILPLRLPLGRRTARLAGWSAMAAGTWLAAWAVSSASAANVAVDRPTGLVTTGAYAVSRNPMYEGWSLTVAGLGIATRSVWLLAAAVLATAATHREVLAEEMALSEAFGREFATYTATTPRYLWPSDAVATVASVIRGRPSWR